MIKLNGEIVKEFEGEYEKQAKEFCDKTKTNIYINFVDCVRDPFEDGSNNYANKYKVIIKRNNKQMTVIFTDSIYNCYNGKEPTVYDILSCLTKYDPYNFEDFCYEFGYDLNSRKAYKTYLAVQKEYDNIMRLFDDVIEELQEIQ